MLFELCWNFELRGFGENEYVLIDFVSRRRLRVIGGFRLTCGIIGVIISKR